MRFFVEWMRKLGIAFNQEISEARMALYAEALMDLSPEALETAFRQCVQTCHFFPTVADIRDQVRKQLDATDTFNAERSWVLFKQLFSRWHPDVGFLDNDLPELDEAGEYALRTIGGFSRFSQTEKANENFIRKEFIAAYQRYRETGGYLAPTREQAAALLDKLKKGELPE